MSELKLFMLLLGGKPKGRNTEQHDVFFGIGKSLKDLVEQIGDFWPEAKDKIHIDAWREVTQVDNYTIEISNRDSIAKLIDEKLFFINLGGYKPNEFEEFHYKILGVQKDKTSAISTAKDNLFYKHNQSPHVDDKYGIDVDDIYDVEEILPQDLKNKFAIKITSAEEITKDELHIGYIKLADL